MKKVASTTAGAEISVKGAVAAPPGMIDWDLAQRVAAGALLLKPAPSTYRSAPLQSQFDELTARAEFLVSEATGLHSAHGAARAKVTDRAQWAAANVRSMERLIGPTLAEIQRKGLGKKVGKSALSASRVMSGTQLGLLLAYMYTRSWSSGFSSLMRRSY